MTHITEYTDVRKTLLEAKKEAVEAAWPEVDIRLETACAFVSWLRKSHPAACLMGVDKQFGFALIDEFDEDENEVFISRVMPIFKTLKIGTTDWQWWGTLLTRAILNQKLTTS